MQNNKSIEEDINSNKIKNEMAEQNKNFDLESFYYDSTSYNDAAIGVITPKQTIFLPVKELHQTTLQSIYQQLYGEFLDDKSFEEIHENYIKEALQKGNIIIELCNQPGNVAFFPEKITPKQLTEYKNFAKKLRRINYNLIANGREKVNLETNINTEAPTNSDEFFKYIEENMVDPNRKIEDEKNIVNDEKEKNDNEEFII